MDSSLDWARATRLALVVPGDCHLDDELWRLTAPGGLPFVSRTTGADPVQMQFNALGHTIALAESSDIEMAADRLRAVTPAAAAYVDTSISFVRGPGGDTEIADRIARLLRCPTVTTSTAVVRASRALGVSRLAVLTVYTDEINERIPAFFEPQGIRIVQMHKLDTTMERGLTSLELARIDPDELVTAGEAAVAATEGAADSPADAVFIPCTAVRTLESIEPLEAAVGLPVIAAIHATMWAVQRLAGINADVPLGGRLFETS